MFKFKTTIKLCCAAVAVIGAQSAWASDSWPTRSITYVAPFPVGSNTDTLGRIIADGLGKKLNVSVVVENRPGATGMIGSTHVANAKPDGYTIMGGSIASHAINAALFDNMQYDAEASFEPITVIGFNANTLVVSNDSPLKSVRDVIEAAKAAPESISFASTGIGTTQHLSGVMLGEQAKIQLVHTPYAGKSPLPDIIGRNVSMMFEGPSVVPHVQAGNLRALAVTSPARLASLPEVPTMKEAGLPDYEIQAWQAIFAPKGTPKPIIDKLYGAIREVLDSPEVQEKLNTMGVEPSGMPPAEFAAFQKEEIAKWRQLIEAAGVKVQ